MSYKIEVFSDRPVILHTLNKDFSQAKESIASLEHATRLLNEQREPVFFIWDVRENTFSLDDVIVGANLVTRQVDFFKNPNIREVLLITENRMVQMAAKGLDTPIFGNVKVHSFNNLDEALAYVDRNL